MPSMRYAVITPSPSQMDMTEAARVVEAYLPTNYKVIAVFSNGWGSVRWHSVGNTVLVGGTDDSGWTLDEYVLPRLGSGLHFGREVTREEIAEATPA